MVRRLGFEHGSFWLGVEHSEHCHIPMGEVNWAYLVWQSSARGMGGWSGMGSRKMKKQKPAFCWCSVWPTCHDSHAQRIKTCFPKQPFNASSSKRYVCVCVCVCVCVYVLAFKRWLGVFSLKTFFERTGKNIRHERADHSNAICTT